MSLPPETIPNEILLFGQECSEGLKSLVSDRERIQYVQSILPGLLLQKELFIRLMDNMTSGRSFPDIHRSTTFDNEVLLYEDIHKRFSLRMYLWGPGDYTEVHDHNAWGVIGTVMGLYEAVSYRREDDGSVEGYALLKETGRRVLAPGETGFTLPFDAGIHKTGNPTRDTIISLNLYGTSGRRGYIQGFDVAGCRAYRILPPRHKKKYLARKALESLREGSGQSVEFPPDRAESR